MLIDGPFKPTPADALKYGPIDLGEGGRRVLSLITRAQGEKQIVRPKHALNRQDFSLPGYSEHLHIDGPYTPRLEFGDLDDPDGVSKIILFAFSQDAGPKGDKTPFDYGRELIVPNSTVVELLKDAQPGTKVAISKEGKHREYAKARTTESRIAADSYMNFDITSDGIYLPLLLNVDPDSGEVLFLFNRYLGEAQTLLFSERGLHGKPTVRPLL